MTGKVMINNEKSVGGAPQRYYFEHIALRVMQVFA